MGVPPRAPFSGKTRAQPTEGRPRRDAHTGYLQRNRYSSFHSLALRPVVALDKNLTVGGHAGFGISDRTLELQLDSNDLLHALIAEVSILRRKRGLRVDPR